MQRLKLYVQGVKLPKLGSVQDKVLRGYVQYEEQLEAKRSEFSMLTALTNPQITDPNKFRNWSSGLQRIWKDYVGLLMHVELPEQNDEEQMMLEYYSKVVKNLKPSAKQGKDGSIEVSGLKDLK